jgi:hypothetical protein
VLHFAIELALLKTKREIGIFKSFSESASLPLDLDSVRSEKPPRPDIKFTMSSKPYCAELVEITDEVIAKSREITLRTGMSVATSYSSSDPLIRSFKEKAEKDYQTDGAPLILLAYYEKQYPVTYDPDFIQRHISNIAQSMVRSGKWESIWVYDHWEKRVLWKLLRS